MRSKWISVFTLFDFFTEQLIWNLNYISKYKWVATIQKYLTTKQCLHRIKPVLDSFLRLNHNVFRQNRTTVGQIISVRILVGVECKNLTAIITFVDFKKAFDSIHRGKMIKVLKSYGIPIKIVSAINISYENMRDKVNTPDGKTEDHHIYLSLFWITHFGKIYKWKGRGIVFYHCSSQKPKI